MDMLACVYRVPHPQNPDLARYFTTSAGLNNLEAIGLFYKGLQLTATPDA